MRRTWRFKHRRIAEPAALGDGEQLVVGNAAPQEERQARRQLDVADPVNGPGTRIRRIELHAENELGRHQDLLQRQSHARLEPAGPGALLVEGEELRQIVGSDRPPIGAVREAGDDLFRASLLFGGRRRMADENLVAARCCPRSLHIEGAGNRNAAHAFEMGLDRVTALLELECPPAPPCLSGTSRRSSASPAFTGTRILSVANQAHLQRRTPGSPSASAAMVNSSSL